MAHDFSWDNGVAFAYGAIGQGDSDSGLIADDDQSGGGVRFFAAQKTKNTYPTDRSSCLENPRPKGGIPLRRDFKQ